ncbi:Polysaccharide biosynthesis/export protein [Posidoniimonas polymericola]|uniref:Polysaccharide biosynthesis/export protein n=1 Tax=Posidoniimonas polymericola TaxID=2528002 RepID=A0A5C5ZFN0_9BACT|nr:polysaccharide biosynthesis/export family protein [Posidoniimonas polymericola]TWT85905.1 Polysaccharide biosynthesis/export protein [Posidoniimonas polymericola]
MTNRSKHVSNLVVLSLLVTCCGCHVIRWKTPEPLPPCGVPASIPKELSKASLPEYVIEPPDVLTVSAVDLVPRQPYRLRPLDTVQIQASGVPEDTPLGGAPQGYTIGFDGTIVVGFDYDKVGEEYHPIQAAGLTLAELRAELEQRARSVARAPQVWVTLVSIASQQDVAGEHLVAPDGKVTLGAYGRVCVVGMTIPEARAAIEAHLMPHFENPKVSVDVFGFNSKVYYVVTQGAGLGDGVFRLPVKGSETVLDAVAELQGLTATSSLRMWVARPGFNQSGGDQVMPVDWLGITQRGDVRTNYQLMPGDRLYVAEDKLVSFDTRLAKIFSPVERIFGVTLLGTQTGNSMATYGSLQGGIVR